MMMMRFIENVVVSTCVIFSFWVSDAATTRHPTSANSGSILSEILDDLDLRSDNRIRPGYGGAPVEIRAFAFIRDVVDINEGKSTMTVNLLLMQMWTDPRLTFESEQAGWKDGVNEILIDNPEFMWRLWNPDTFIMNEVATNARYSTTTPTEKGMANQVIKVTRNGDVLKTTRITVVVSCPMRFENYPVHSFECDIDLESFSHKADSIVYSWRNGSKSADLSRIDKTTLAGKTGYFLDSVQTLSRMSYVDTGGSYSRLVVRFQYKKLWMRHVITYFLPTTILTACSLLSLWGIRRKFAAGGVFGNFIVAGVIILLVSLEYSTCPVLSRAPYFTPVDFQLGICFSAVFSCIAYHGVNLCCRNSGCFRKTVNNKLMTSNKKSESEDQNRLTTRLKSGVKQPDADDEVTYYESYDLSADDDDDDDDVFGNDQILSNTNEQQQQQHHHQNNPSDSNGGLAVDATLLGRRRPRRRISSSGKNITTMRSGGKLIVRCIVRTFLCFSKWLSLISFVLGECLLWYTFTIGGGRSSGIAS